MDELDMAIQKLENQFLSYLKNPEQTRMPNMEELVKLRIKRKRLCGL